MHDSVQPHLSRRIFLAGGLSLAGGRLLSGSPSLQVAGAASRPLPALPPRLRARRPLCPVASDVKRVLAASIDGLRNAGVRLDEGWPADVDPREQHETYRYLLAAFFAFQLKDEGIEEVRTRAAKPDGGMDSLEARVIVEPHEHFMAASSRRMLARARWQDYFRSHDAFLMPTSFAAAFSARPQDSPREAPDSRG